MSECTIKNLKDDVGDQAPNFGLSPDLGARFARDSLDMENAGISYQRLAPGFRSPFGHTHRKQEEVYVLVGGRGRAFAAPKTGLQDAEPTQGWWN